MGRSKVRGQKSAARSQIGFALYEVLLGVTIFAVGVLVIGRSISNCLNASTINAEEDRVRQILANRMAEIQATPTAPDASAATNIDSGYGPVKLIQKSAASGLKENDVDLVGISRVTLRAEWERAGINQTQRIEFYVYRH
jgi:Tfp pilus assembly protein PilV